MRITVQCQYILIYLVAKKIIRDDFIYSEMYYNLIKLFINYLTNNNQLINIKEMSYIT